MQQLGTSVFHTVVRWHKSSEMEIECISHNFIVLVILMPKLSNLINIWQSYDKNNFDCFYWDAVY